MKTLHFWPIAWTLAVFAAIVFALDMLLGVLFPNWWVMQKAWELVMPGEKVQVPVRFENYAGTFLYHCHNLEHEDAGMMRNYRVES